MELKDFIGIELDGLNRNIERVTKGLTDEELKWRPASGCNSIGLILFHVARSEDSFVNARLREKPEVYTKGKWHKKLNLAENEPGAHYTIDQVNAFPVPPLEDIQAYQAAVREQTLAYLKTAKADTFDKKIKMERFGEMPIALIFSIIVSHSAGHVGEISYLRGIQRGMDK
jgi:uncharacterized damage-inducible protein DinB